MAGGYRFEKGNRFWEARSTHGVRPKFADGESLWDACRQYFEWNADNPLQESKAFAYEGLVTIESIPKMRAMTLGAMCLFIDISLKQWIEWRTTRPDLSNVIESAEQIIRQQKFEGASAGMLNPVIISRDLGLVDKQEVAAGITLSVSKEDSEL